MPLQKSGEAVRQIKHIIFWAILAELEKIYIQILNSHFERYSRSIVNRSSLHVTFSIALLQLGARLHGNKNYD